MITDLILVGCSVAHKHSSVTKSLESKPLTHSQLQRKIRTPQPYFFHLLCTFGGNLFILTPSVERCNSVMAEKWAWGDKHRNSSVSQVVSEQILLVPVPDPFTTLPEIITSMISQDHMHTTHQTYTKNSRNSYTSECRTYC